MAVTTHVTLPKLGESILSATIVRWLKQVGDEVSLDEPLLEVATDKVNSEIPAPSAGVLQEIFAAEGEELDVGAPLALILGNDVATPTHVKPAQKVPEQTHDMPNNFLSPAVLRLLREHDVPVSRIGNVRGTGTGGRITKKDIEAYLVQPTVEVAKQTPSQILPLTPMRQAIASHLVRSTQEIPAASLVADVDVTNLLALIQREKKGFLAQHNAKLTITGYVIEALVDACVTHPLMNARYTPEGIAYNNEVNLGIAVHVDDGLVVPVIKQAEKRPFAKKVSALQSLKHAAQQKKLQQSDLEGATTTLTNFGISGIELGIPIIPYGQTAILGMGSVQKKVVATDEGAIAVRERMTLSLSFDHRVVDGIYGCEFLNAIKHHLQSF